MWVLRPSVGSSRILAVAGVFVPPGETPLLWLLLCKDFTRNLRQNVRGLRDKVLLLEKLYPELNAWALDDDAIKFASLFGFKVA
jgi:hypothetical protein